MIRINFSLALLAFSPLLLAAPQTSSVPGGLIAIEVNAKQPPKAQFEQKPLLVEALSPGRYRVWLGLGLHLAPGRHSWQLNGQPQWFEIQPKSYPEQHLKIANQSQVNPDPKQLERIQREQQQLKAAFARFSPTTASLDWQWPVQGPAGGAFGLKRFFNGEARAPHSGIDVKAKTGTPIQAVAPGQVVLAQDLFFNGQTVVIDHGQGLLSLYCHLSAIEVKTGQQLKAGDQLGKVGQTGRATGPHLHFSVSLNGVRIDPALWLPKRP